MAKKKGPVLYELLRKDHAEKRSDQGGLPQEAPATVKSQEPSAGYVGSQPPSSRMDAPEVDQETLVFHLTRTHAAIAAGAIIVALLMVAWIGSRAGKTADVPNVLQPVAQTADMPSAAADDESQQPLAMLLPEPGSDPKPDQPVKVLPTGEVVAAAGAGDKAKPAEAGPAAAGTKGDNRTPGLNYLVIQIIPDRPDAEEHVTAVRRFLAEKAIRTIAVPSDSGGTMIMSEEGFNWDDPGDRTRLDKLTETVKKVGKEYASARHTGRYDFRAPFAKKHKG